MGVEEAVRETKAFAAARGGYRRSLLRLVDYVGGIALAIVWLRSSAAHLANPYYFLSSVYQYELVGVQAGRIVAMTLPFLQLVLAVCLIGRVFAGGALLVSSLLLATFAGVQASAIVRDLGISCGCFGASSSSATIGTSSISTVLLLWLLATVCCACHVALQRAVPAEDEAGASRVGT